MNDALPSRVKFGAFELDLRAGELRSATEDSEGALTVRLQEKSLRVLLLLIEHGGEVVTRQELQKQLWPNDTVVDFEHGINTAVKNLRRALGDSTDRPKYIETVARRGYRLKLPVEWVKPAGEESSDLDEPFGAKFRVGQLTGKTLSHYRVLEIIGGGGMGLVYRAEDLKLGRAVALKFLPEEVGNDPKALERLEREARAVSALDHPNICSVFEFDEYEGHPFIVMQLLHGKTLRDHVAEGRLRLSDSDGLDVAIQIAAGLEAAHEKGIIHRDIKPANIFITETEVAKILDFGVVKVLESAEPQELSNSADVADRQPTNAVAPDLTRTGLKLGTAGYMSPEQIGGEALDARTDIFSFGLVLYEMATGQRAFIGDTAAMVHAAIVNQQPTPVRELNSEVPHTLEQIVDKALEKDRERRYQSASDIRTELTRLRRDQESGRYRPLRWISALASVVLIVVAGTFYWNVQHKRQQPAPLPELKQRQITTNTSDNPVRDAWISPDGKQLAYSDQKGIHLKFIATGETQTLPAPEVFGGKDVDWGPGPWLQDRSALLAVASASGEQPSTWSFSLMNGTARKLRDDAGTQDISPDGSQLVFTTNPGKIGDREIWVMDINGEHAQRLYETGEDGRFEGAQWSPDGQRMAYMRSRESPAKWDTFLESRDLLGGPATTILSFGPWWQKGGLRGYVWLPGGRLIYILGDNDLNGFSCNYWELLVDEHTGEPRSKPRQLTNWAGFCMQNMTVTADGRRLSYLRVSFQRSVQVADLDANGTVIRNPLRLTSSEGNEYPTGWTADSKAVIFHSNRNGSWGIYKQSLEKEEPEAIVMGTDEVAPAASILSPDGSSLIYTLVRADKGGASPLPREVMRVPIAGGVPQPLMTASLSGPPRCTRLPANLCAVAERTTNGMQLIFTALDPMRGRGRELGRFAIDPIGSYSWDLSPDGTRIAISKQPGRRFDILFLNGHPTQTVTVEGWDLGVDTRVGGRDRLRSVDFEWAADGGGFITAAQEPKGSALLYVDLKGHAHILKEQKGGLSPTVRGGFSGPWGVPSPDGRHLAILNWTRNSNVWMMDNF